ncbi:MAG: hypothetical protein J0M08_05095 [Bacteroidetes bacterium]|nr:hypothetical protein [Bacteroidota bacterium]
MEQKNTQPNQVSQQTTNPLLKLRQNVVNNVDEHNMEMVAQVKGVTYINDSKSLSVDITISSLELISAKSLLIIGGADKGTDYAKLLKENQQKIKAIIYLGVEEENIVKNYKTGSKLFVTALTVEEAVRVAYWYAKEDDVVLFSPACHAKAFESYRERGDEFKKAVAQLRG